eukprot:scaffold11046_cov183-Amphora_coffeaeformis.AAC.15
MTHGGGHHGGGHHGGFFGGGHHGGGHHGGGFGGGHRGGGHHGGGRHHHGGGSMGALFGAAHRHSHAPASHHSSHRDRHRHHSRGFHHALQPALVANDLYSLAHHNTRRHHGTRSTSGNSQTRNVKEAVGSDGLWNPPHSRFRMTLLYFGLFLSALVLASTVWLSGSEGHTLLVVSGDSVRIPEGNQPFTQSTIEMRVVQSPYTYGTGATSSMNLYTLDSCPSLSGPTIQHTQDEQELTLYTDDYQYDYFYLPKGSTWTGTVTVSQGSVQVSLVALHSPWNVPHQLEEESFWTFSYPNELVETHFVDEYDQVAEIDFTTYETDQEYVLIYDSTSISTLTVDWTIQATSYNLDQYESTCEMGIYTGSYCRRERKACMILQLLAGSEYNDDGSIDDVELTVQVLSTRAWSTILILSALPTLFSILCVHASRGRTAKDKQLNGTGDIETPHLDYGTDQIRSSADYKVWPKGDESSSGVLPPPIPPPTAPPSCQYNAIESSFEPVPVPVASAPYRSQSYEPVALPVVDNTVRPNENEPPMVTAIPISTSR